MTDCDYCGETVDIPFRCKFCGGTFCSAHRLPESHECEGLGEYKRRSRGSEKVIYEPFRPISRSEKPPSPISEKIPSLFNTFANNFYLAIIGICFTVFILQFSIEGFSQMFYMKPALGDIMGRPWILLTSIFMHGGTWHLFVNMLVLFFFGGELERRIGSRKFLEIFLISGIAANLGFTAFSIFTGSTTPALGASGAIFGVFSALAIIAPEIRVLLWFVFPLKIRHALILFALWDLFLLPHGGPVANSAHLSGVLIGLIYGYILKKKQKSSFLDRIGI